MVQQKTELGSSVDHRIHGSECRYSGGHLAETTPGGVRCDRGRSNVDSFTKALARDQFEKLRAGIGLV